MGAHDHDPAIHDEADLGVFRFYHVPIQMQRRGEKQHSPHTDWGNIFFDLIYVAAAYKLGVLLDSTLEENATEGVLVVLATFLVIQQPWSDKMMLDSKFNYESLLHKIQDTVEFMAVAIATACIVTTSKFVPADPYHADPSHADPCHHKTSNATHACRKGPTAAPTGAGTTLSPLDRFQSKDEMFAMGVTCALLVHTASMLIRRIELIVQLRGTEAARQSKHEIVLQSIPTIIIHAVALCLSDSDDVEWVPVCWAVNAAFNMWWRLPCYWVNKDYFFINIVPVPMNIDFTVHRWGEFTMLMLGEAVLSPLLVESRDDEGYFATLLLGLLITVSNQLLYFTFQPRSIQTHVLRRSVPLAILFATGMVLFCAALIFVGVGNKGMVKYAHRPYVPEKYTVLLTFSLVASQCCFYFLCYQSHAGGIIRDMLRHSAMIGTFKGNLYWGLYFVYFPTAGFLLSLGFVDKDYTSWEVSAQVCAMSIIATAIMVTMTKLVQTIEEACAYEDARAERLKKDANESKEGPGAQAQL